MPKREMEEVLIQHPDVAEVCAVDVPHKTHGTIPAACVVLRANAECCPEALRSFCRERLTRTSPDHLDVAILPAMPRNNSGMVSRQKLQEFFRDKKTKVA